MEIKKNAHANLEKYKGLFMQLGLVVALLVSLLAFEWTTQDVVKSDLGELKDAKVEEDQMPITRQEQQQATPPPQQQTVDMINIVEDDANIDEQLEVQDVEADQNTQIEMVELKEEEEEATIFTIVEEMPEFQGGELALRKWLVQNVKYPALARESDIKGKVYVRFAVTESGSVEKVQIARGVHPLLDEEAIRVVKLLPKWKPGKQRGKPVSVWYTVPINFQLQ